MTTAALQHLALGIVSTVLAALRVLAWVSAGLALGAGRLPARATRATVAILAGACLTIVIYAAFAAAALLWAAVAVDAAVALGFIVLRGGEAASLLRSVVERLIPQSRSGRVAFSVVALLLWVIAIGPPRDGDVMHYHLAHIRQIIAFGVWRQLPICSYGIPFGWSLTYLPFEWIGLPQVAHLVNSATWLLTCALCIDTAEQSSAESGTRWADAARWLLLGASLVPMIMKAATTAMADAFMMMVVALTLALLVQQPRIGRSGAVALGFAAYAGLTTRYQAAAVAIAVTAIVAVDMLRGGEARQPTAPFAAGALVAIVAAAPFYIANQITLGSPVWPFGASSMSSVGIAPRASHAVTHLADICASRAVAGGWTALPGALGRLLFGHLAFPIPLLLVCGSIAVLFTGPSSIRRVAVFNLLFLATWCFVQPTLEPHFSIYLTAGAVICALPIIARVLASRAATALRMGGEVSLGVLAIIAMLYARDYLRLAATGDVARFHHATWYWPAYDWANHNTPDSARFVEVLYGGHTYPLHRWNVSADPGSSAILPWASVNTVCDLAAFLRRERVDFVFYGPNVWTGRPMSDRIGATISGAIAAGVLDPVKAFTVPIVYGRMEGREFNTDVMLYRVDKTAARSNCS